MKRVKMVVLPLLLCAGLAGLASAGENEPRTYGTFPFDAHTTKEFWFDVSVQFQSLPDSAAVPKAQDLLAQVNVAFSPADRVEVGASGSLISRNYDRDAFGKPSGISDILAWAKYRFYQSGDVTMSAGAFANLPTGNENKGLGSSSTDFGGYLAMGTRTRGDGFVQAHVGLRVNGDLTSHDPLHRSLSGKTSVLVGFGGVLPAGNGVEAFGSFNLETERYEDGDSFAQLVGGARWRLSGPWRLQAHAGVGLADAAPNLSLGFGLVYSH